LGKNNSELVRFSRDGDQFHYLWAARRCLLLLSPTSGLVAVSIEGASKAENAPGKSLNTGEELIDVAEYYGNEVIEKASCVRYIQLKHSTKHADKPWTASGLEKTLRGFANRYIALKQLSEVKDWLLECCPPDKTDFYSIRPSGIVFAGKIFPNGVAERFHFQVLGRGSRIIVNCHPD